MTSSGALEQTAVGTLPHTSSGWLGFGVVLLLIGLMHVVLPRFMWRIRTIRRGPDTPRQAPDEMVSRHRWFGAVMAALGLLIVVLAAVFHGA